MNEIVGANSAKLKVAGVGKTVLNLKDNENPLSNVLHVPGLSANFLSSHHIVNKGNNVLFDSDGCTIRNANKPSRNASRQMVYIKLMHLQFYACKTRMRQTHTRTFGIEDLVT